MGLYPRSAGIRCPSSPAISPSLDRVVGVSVNTPDFTAGKIPFADAGYDIAEPVYPEEFIGMLFSCAD